MSIKVPRITLSANYDDDSSFGELSLLSLGYGLHQAWIYAAMFSASSVFGVASRATGVYNTNITLPFLVSIIVYSLCFLIYAATDQRFLNIYVSKKTLTICTCLMSIGCLMLMFISPNSSDTLTIALEVASGFATGIGSSMFIIFWGVAFARKDSSSIVLNTAVAVVIGFALYAFVIRETPQPISGIITSLIPVAELFILRSKTPRPYFQRGEIPIFSPLPVKKSSFVLRFGCPVLVLGLALGILRQTSVQSILPASSFSSQALLLLAAICTTVLILITVMALNGASRWNRLFRPLIPFVAITAFFLPMAAADNFTLSTFMLLIGYMCFEALMWIFFGELSQRFRLSPVFVYGLGRGLLAIGALLGSLIPVFTLQWVEALPFKDNTVIIVILVIMVIAYAILPTEHEIEAIVIPCPLVRAVSSQLDSEEKGKKVGGRASIVNDERWERMRLEKDAAYAEAFSGKDTKNAGVSNETDNACVLEDSTQDNDTNKDCARKDSDSVTARSQASDSADDTSLYSEDVSPAGHDAHDSLDSKTSVAAQKSAEENTTSIASKTLASVSIVSFEEGAKLPDSNEGNNSASSSQGTNNSGSTSKTDMPSASSSLSGTSSHSPSYSDGTPIGHAVNTTHNTQETMSEARLAMYAKLNSKQGVPEEKKYGRFRRKCEAAANTFLLSRRETEVMFFLAKGHNSAYIQEKLYISEGTAKTHIRHIYRKLDVHTQQELMRLVESIEIPEF